MSSLCEEPKGPTHSDDTKVLTYSEDIAEKEEWRRRESNPRPKVFSYRIYTCFTREELHPSDLPGRAREMFAQFKFRQILLQAWEDGGYPTS